MICLLYTSQAELVPGERRAEFECRLAEWKQEQTALEAYRDRPTVTAEGHAVGLYCNIFSTDTAKKAQELGADGAGLFRTEFLYTGRPDLPGEEEQFAVYKAALEAMPGKAITFRTMDIGGDKPVEALGPVSYTHLDVYKRQHLRSGDLLPETQKALDYALLGARAAQRKEADNEHLLRCV